MKWLEELGISKWSAALTFICTGWAGLARLICEAFTKLLEKADADKLREYSELAGKVAKFIRYGVELFVKSEKVKAAATETADEVQALAEHISDGRYDPDELEADLAAIKFCINSWKAVSK